MTAYATIPGIFLVDDDGEASASLIRALKALGVSAQMDAYTTAAAALQALKKRISLEVAVLDLSLEPMKGPESGFELLRDILKQSPDTRAIILTGHGSDEYGIKALSLGAASFLEKPANPAHLAALIRDGIAQSTLRRRARDLENKASASSVPVLIGTSKATADLRREIDFLSINALSVFLRGETGVGKSFFANCLHQLGNERGAARGRFISYAPRGENAELVSSDLFGHVKGAFTGATENKLGLLHVANGGTLFLDEVDELPPEVQVTLLSVLQERRFRPLGSTVDEPFTGRIISASNGDYGESQRTGKLRQDLFHRLAQEIIIIPALRERREDIPLLATFFLNKYNERFGSIVTGFSETASKCLYNYGWPGNVRELEKSIERAAARAAYERRTLIENEDLPASVSGQQAVTAQSASNLSFADQVEEFKIALIETALAKNGGNQARAAQSLRLDRSLLRRIYARKKQ